MGGLISEEILSKQFLDINWLKIIKHPLKRSIGVSLKVSIRFVPGFTVVDIQIPMEWSNLPNSSAGPLIL